jgi:hypothetical protein
LGRFFYSKNKGNKHTIHLTAYCHEGNQTTFYAAMLPWIFVVPLHSKDKLCGTRSVPTIRMLEAGFFAVIWEHLEFIVVPSFNFTIPEQVPCMEHVETRSQRFDASETIISIFYFSEVWWDSEKPGYTLCKLRNPFFLKTLETTYLKSYLFYQGGR